MVGTLDDRHANEKSIKFPVGDPPPYGKHREQGIPVPLQQGSHDPVISNLLKVIQERYKHSAPPHQQNNIDIIPQNGKSISFDGLEVISV